MAFPGPEQLGSSPTRPPPPTGPRHIGAHRCGVVRFALFLGHRSRRRTKRAQTSRDHLASLAGTLIELDDVVVVVDELKTPLEESGSAVPGVGAILDDLESAVERDGLRADSATAGARRVWPYPIPRRRCRRARARGNPERPGAGPEKADSASVFFTEGYRPAPPRSEPAGAARPGPAVACLALL